MLGFEWKAKLAKITVFHLLPAKGFPRCTWLSELLLPFAVISSFFFPLFFLFSFAAVCLMDDFILLFCMSCVSHNTWLQGAFFFKQQHLIFI